MTIGLRVLAVALHPHRERLEPAQHEVAVERARHRADRVLQEPDALGDLGVVGGDEPAHDVGVTAEVLGRRVHDDVGAELERPLQERRGERVVDDDARAALVRDRADAEDVDDGERGVGGRLDPHQRGAVGPVALERVEVGEVGDGPLDARRCEHLRHQPEGAAVRVVGDDHALAGLEQPQHRVLGRHAAGEREAVERALERRQALLVARGGWGCRCARTRSPRACRPPRARTSTRA